MPQDKEQQEAADQNVADADVHIALGHRSLVLPQPFKGTRDKANSHSNSLLAYDMLSMLSTINITDAK